MARKGKHSHEDHVNHEAWAIPYGDLMTLLLAFFVVMYAISSVNEGKYRVLSNSLSEAFGGSPRSIQPIQVGPAGGPAPQSRPVPLGVPATPIRLDPIQRRSDGPHPSDQLQASLPVSLLRSERDTVRHRAAQAQLASIAVRLEEALEDLVARDLVILRREDLWLEVEIRSDILFESGSAVLGPAARVTVGKLGAILAEVPNTLRIEGHTDDVPIRTAVYPSNWELSAARAASVVHAFVAQSISPGRMAVVGQGEFHPRAGNDTAEGRNANRRVVLLILAEPQFAGPGAPRSPAPVLAVADAGGAG